MITTIIICLTILAVIGFICRKYFVNPNEVDRELYQARQLAEKGAYLNGRASRCLERSRSDVRLVKSGRNKKSVRQGIKQHESSVRSQH